MIKGLKDNFLYLVFSLDLITRFIYIFLVLIIFKQEFIKLYNYNKNKLN